MQSIDRIASVQRELLKGQPQETFELRFFIISFSQNDFNYCRVFADIFEFEIVLLIKKINQGFIFADIP